VPFPKPIQATGDQFHDLNCLWVEVHGVVRFGKVVGDKATLELVSGGSRIPVDVYGSPEEVPVPVDTEVKICGVASGIYNQRRQMVSPRLIVPDKSNILICNPAAIDPSAIPLLSAESLLQAS